MFMFHFMANFVNTRKNFQVGNAEAPTRFLGLCTGQRWEMGGKKHKMGAVVKQNLN